MTSESIKYMVAADNGNLIERFYTLCVRWIQNSFVRADVWVDAKRGKHLARQPNESQAQKLRDIGLVPERIWWGPLTLRVQKLLFLLEEIERKPPKRIIEMGSGASTALFAALGEKYDFDVFSIENHPKSVDYVRYLLDGLACSRRVTMQQCGFKWRRLDNGKRYWWFDYDLDRLGGLFDFVFIDAPMGQLAGRLGAIPEMVNYLSKDHRIYLDDSDRAHEQSIIAIWKQYFPQLIEHTIDGCPDITRISVGGAH